MKEHGNSLSRNPNVCACCSSLLDGMDDDFNLDAESAAKIASVPDGIATVRKADHSNRRAAKIIPADKSDGFRKAA